MSWLIRWQELVITTGGSKHHEREPDERYDDSELVVRDVES